MPQFERRVLLIGTCVPALWLALTGLIFDPTYTGKAVYALKREIDRGRFSADDDVVLWHTGGGFAALAFDYGDSLDG